VRTNKALLFTVSGKAVAAGFVDATNRRLTLCRSVEGPLWGPLLILPALPVIVYLARGVTFASADLKLLEVINQTTQPIKDTQRMHSR